MVMAVGLSLFSGCGGREETASKPEEAPAAPESSDTETQEAPDAEAETDAENSKAAAADGSSWKQDTSDCTVTWFMAYDWYGKKFDEVNNLFDKKLYEETGVKIDIQTGDTDKLNMLIQTGKLPDIVTMDANLHQRKLWRTTAWCSL